MNLWSQDIPIIGSLVDGADIVIKPPQAVIVLDANSSYSCKTSTEAQDWCVPSDTIRWDHQLGTCDHH